MIEFKNICEMNIKVDNTEYLFHFDFVPNVDDVIEYAKTSSIQMKEDLAYFLNMHKIIWALYKGCFPDFEEKWDTKKVSENGTTVSISGIWRKNLATKKEVQND